MGQVERNRSTANVFRVLPLMQIVLHTTWGRAAVGLVCHNAAARHAQNLPPPRSRRREADLSNPFDRFNPSTPLDHFTTAKYVSAVSVLLIVLFAP